MAADGTLPGVIRIGRRTIRVDREKLIAGLSEGSQDAPRR
jgi:hypothetical protein